jgi:hypothetical protein
MITTHVINFLYSQVKTGNRNQENFRLLMILKLN